MGLLTEQETMWTVSGRNTYLFIPDTVTFPILYMIPGIWICYS